MPTLCQKLYTLHGQVQAFSKGEGIFYLKCSAKISKSLKIRQFNDRQPKDQLFLPTTVLLFVLLKIKKARSRRAFYP